MYKHLLFATDLQEGSHEAALRAQAIAQHFNAQLFIIHVIESTISEQYAQMLGFTELITPSTAEAKQVLATLAEELDIPPNQQYVEIGSAAHLIVNLAKQLDVDAIIIGSHAHSALPNFLGTTANTIVHSAPCDVITLRLPTASQ